MTHEPCRIVDKERRPQMIVEQSGGIQGRMQNGRMRCVQSLWPRVWDRIHVTWLYDKPAASPLGNAPQARGFRAATSTTHRGGLFSDGVDIVWVLLQRMQSRAS